jgi:hypothetical protein
VLTRQVGLIVIDYHAVFTILIIPHTASDLVSVSYIHDEGPDRISAKIQTNGVFASHPFTLLTDCFESSWNH